MRLAAPQELIKDLIPSASDLTAQVLERASAIAEIPAEAIAALTAVIQSKFAGLALMGLFGGSPNLPHPDMMPALDPIEARMPAFDLGNL